MSTIINGTSSAITFPDATVQNTAVVSPSVIGQIPFSTDGSTFTPTAKVASGTAVASTSGTSIDFTSIPSWVKRITVMFNGVSTNGTSPVLIQIGSGSVTTTGYLGSANSANFTTGFSDGIGNASANRQGIFTLSLFGSNVWVCGFSIGASGVTISNGGGGFSVPLSGTLDRVRITTVNGTDTFDAGSINILYE